MNYNMDSLIHITANYIVKLKEHPHCLDKCSLHNLPSCYLFETVPSWFLLPVNL